MQHELIITNSQCLYRVPAEDIIYIEADGNYSHLVLLGGEDVVLTMQIGKLAEQIDLQLKGQRSALAKIGRSLIINLDCVYYINPQKGQLVLRDGNGHRTRPLSAPLIALKGLKEAMEQALDRRLCNENINDKNDHAE